MDKYFTYDPENGFETYKTEKKQMDGMRKSIDSCKDEEWDEGVEDIIAGIITHCTTKFNVINKPDKIDSDGLDEDGMYWSEHIKYMCDYKITKIRRFK